MSKSPYLMLLLIGALASQVFGQAEVERFDRQLELIRRSTRLRVDPNVPAAERTYFDYGGFTTLSYLSLDDPDLQNTAMWQYELGAYAHLMFDGAHEVFFRGRLFHRDFSEGDRFNSDGEDIDGRIDRLFYRFDWARYMAAYQGTEPQGNVSLKIGRDLAIWGNGLTLSTDLDAFTLDLTNGQASLELLAGVTPLDTVDFDSSRTRFDSHTKRGLFGALASLRAGQHRPYIYALNQRDYNTGDDIKADPSDPSVIPTRFNYNSHYIGIGSTGALTDHLSYGIEATYEGGSALSNSFTVNDLGQNIPSDQTHQYIQAYALDARVDYLLPEFHATRLSAEAVLATGDSDRITSTNTLGGNMTGSPDRGFNAFGLIDVGTAFSPAVSNLLAFRVGATSFPFSDTKQLKRMQLGTDLYLFAKLDQNAPIDEETTAHKFLGFEPDVYMNWQITSDITFSARYGLFVPGDAVVNDGKMRQFLYTGITVAF